MKKYFVIGNPIEHSLSPKLHNYWIKENKINANYAKLLLNNDALKETISKIKEDIIAGINVTIPFKKSIIPYVDVLSPEANETQSVNTVFKQDKKIIGHNTDIGGFELSLRHIKFNAAGKTVFILGAGGVSPSIISALIKMKVSKIYLSNRSPQKAKDLKLLFKEINLVDWGDFPNFDIIINATSVGLNKEDDLKIDYKSLGQKKLFYDVIYNPLETKFLKKAKENGNLTINGKMMFIYQAHQAFTIWHKIMPKVNEEIFKLLDK